MKGRLRKCVILFFFLSARTVCSGWERLKWWGRGLTVSFVEDPWGAWADEHIRKFCRGCWHAPLWKAVLSAPTIMEILGIKFRLGQQTYLSILRPRKRSPACLRQIRGKPGPRRRRWSEMLPTLNQALRSQGGSSGEAVWNAGDNGWG